MPDSSRSSSGFQDFEAIDRLRKNLANAYMERAEALLDNNRASAARPMLEKARDLMGWRD